MQTHTARFPQARAAYIAPASLTPLRNRLRRRQKAVAPKGVPYSLSNHEGSLHHHGLSGIQRSSSATPFIPLPEGRGFRGWFCEPYTRP